MKSRRKYIIESRLSKACTWPSLKSLPSCESPFGPLGIIKQILPLWAHGCPARKHIIWPRLNCNLPHLKFMFQAFDRFTQRVRIHWLFMRWIFVGMNWQGYAGSRRATVYLCYISSIQAHKVIVQIRPMPWQFSNISGQWHKTFQRLRGQAVWS